jgi:hypothetical protein
MKQNYHHQQSNQQSNQKSYQCQYQSCKTCICSSCETVTFCDCCDVYCILNNIQLCKLKNNQIKIN